MWPVVGPRVSDKVEVIEVPQDADVEVASHSGEVEKVRRVRGGRPPRNVSDGDRVSRFGGNMVSVADEHVQKEGEASWGQGASLFTALVDGKGGRRTRHGAGHTGEI